MSHVTPESAEDLAQALREAAMSSRTITVIGNGSKRLMGGPIWPADVTISTSGLRGILAYEPNDLTISVEAGMPFAELQAHLAAQGQMIALDPPFLGTATVGGIVASNSSGPMRRTFGTARDLIIGMSFATLEGKIIRSGGMVVKNVAGLDMGKLMIGSFGTLAVMTSLNFRLHTLPRQTRTFLFSFDDLDSAIEKRDSIIRSALQPLALDLLSPSAAVKLGLRGYVVAVRAGGSPAVLARYARDLDGSTQLATVEEESGFWEQVREFPSTFLEQQPSGIVLRISTTITQVRNVHRLTSEPCVSRAASGVSYVCAASWDAVPSLWQAAAEQGWTIAVEFAPDAIRREKDLWFSRSSKEGCETLKMMKRLKQMFDPGNLLNRSRLYGRI